jgi:hypothetical protein
MRLIAVSAASFAALVLSTAGMASDAPSVRFTSPHAMAKTGSTVTFTVKLSHFKIDAKDVGKAKMAGHGHLHFSLDGGKFDFPKYSGANGKLAVTLGVAGKYSPSVTPSITYKNLPKGKHTVKVWLANNDHSNVGASATRTFTVR